MGRAFRDLPEFLEFLEERGDLLRIRSEADPRLEIAEIARRSVRAGAPALLFERVRGSRWPVAINVLAHERRVAWGLGEESLDPAIERIRSLLRLRPPAGLVAALKDLGGTLEQIQWLRSLAPQRVSRGDFEEVTEARVDLGTLPVLTCWPRDGGPTVTFPLVFTRNPETGESHVGVYRLQVYGPDTLGFHVQVHRVGAENLRRHARRGEKMPVAVALGADPATLFAALSPVPEGLSKLAFAGFLRGQPVPVVRLPGTELEVPAACEIVLEGYVNPAERHVEGPFGDHTGFYSLPEEFPVLHVTAVHRREAPVYLTTVTGKPPTEDSVLGRVVGRLFLPVIQTLLPEVVDMDLPAEGLFINVGIIAIRKSYPFHARKVMHALWGLGQLMFLRYIVVVDADVNPRDHREVLYRVGLQADPREDLEIVSGPVDQLSVSNRRPNIGGKVGIDATRKLPEEGYGRPWPEEAVTDPGVTRRVEEWLQGEPALARVLGRRKA